eukprot:m.35523 g.35523  ORF g.35523 m.35523 type:complete len:368 (-) comp5294_c0_seq1:234-1337(-)
MGDKRPPARHPARERVVGTVLVYINMAVVAFVLSVFISIDPSPRRVEDLSWGYLDDHIFPQSDPEYLEWCLQWFTARQCGGPVKMSGYFSLRTAYITYRAWDQFNGNYSLVPVTYNIRYSSSESSCILPYGNICEECYDDSTASAAFTLLLLIIQTLVLIDQLRDSSGRVIEESEDHRRKGLYIVAYISCFVCALVAYNTMIYGCMDKVPVDFSLGPMPILLLATMIANIIQTFLELVWLNASKPPNDVGPDHTKKSKSADNDKWSKPPSRNVAAPAEDPFSLSDKRAEPTGAAAQQPPAREAGAPSKPDFHDPFANMSPTSNATSQGDDGGYTDVAPREAPPGNWGPRSPPPFVPAQHSPEPTSQA